jgi:hypothetical protein
MMHVQALAEIERLHDAVDPTIIVALSACRDANVTFLQRLTGLSAEDFSTALWRLEEAGSVLLELPRVCIRPEVRESLMEGGNGTIAFDMQHRLLLPAMKVNGSLHLHLDVHIEMDR